MPTRTPSLCRRSLPIALAGFLAALGAARAIPPPKPQSSLRATFQRFGFPIAHGIAFGSAEPPLQPGAYFPTISAQALDKSPLIVPTQLAGRQNLLLLSWARDQTSQLDTWTAVAQALQHTHFDFRVYRMLVSMPENALYRWWDNASLRAQETDPELLHWDVPLYTDKVALRRALGISSDEHAVVAVLVDRAGHILWKAQGPSTAATRAGLLAAAQGSH